MKNFIALSTTLGFSFSIIALALTPAAYTAFTIA